MANLFAVAERDPAALGEIEDRLRSSDEFAEVWRPVPTWVIAVAPLPAGVPDPEGARASGIAFAEGRDRLEEVPDARWLDGVLELADRRPDRLGELPGDFGFIRCRDDGSALLVRSCGGLAPFYFHVREGRVAVATLLRYFTRFLPERFVLDPLANAAWPSTAGLVDGRTFLEGVSVAPRGTWTELAPDRAPASTAYWDPRPPNGSRPEPDPEHPRRLRELLIETLERDLDPGGRNLLTLSGGVDSTSLGALVAGTLGLGLSSFSLIPSFEPERGRELSYIEPLTREYGIEPTRRLELTQEARERWTNSAPGLPFQILHPALCELPRIHREEDVRVMVGGEFADEICGELGRIYDWARATPPWRLPLSRDRLPFGRRDYLRWAKGRARDAIGRPFVRGETKLGEWVHPDVDAEYRAWRRRRVRAARDGGPFAELADRVELDGWVAMNWEGTTPLGIRRSIPFFTREVLELAFQCHPSELFGPGKKKLLRAAVRGDVPDRNLDRPDKGGWGTRMKVQPLSLDRALPEYARPVVRPDWFPRPPAEVAWESGTGLVRTLRVGAYLERHAPDSPCGG